MRPGQQNRRMRGRGNTNRKGPNPLSRNYESNGPDVKIRGNAQHIAEKYTALARDLQATGDRVMAENYLQHAEHYNRIILAAQAQNPMPIQRDEAYDDDDYDDDALEQGNGNQHQHEVYDGSGPQPVIEGTPAEVMYGEENNRNNGRNQRQQNNRSERHHNDRNGDRNQGERQNDRQNDRQSDRQNDRQNDRQSDRQGDRHDRQNRMQRPRRHQRPEYGSEQPTETVVAAEQPHNAVAEQPVYVSTEQPVISVAMTPAAVTVDAPVVAEVVEAPVVRRRPRAAAPVVVAVPDEVAAPVVNSVEAEAVSADDEAPTRRPRRVIRPRRTVRGAAKAEGEVQDQGSELAETE